MDNSSHFKICEQCGQSKHISEFSKSYKKLCKSCVAENTKESRKRTQNTQNRSKNTENRTEIPENRTENGIDWEQRRYEIAKEMLAAIYIDDGNAERSDTSKLGFEFKSVQGSAREAVRMADGLIAELQKTKRYGETEE